GLEGVSEDRRLLPTARELLAATEPQVGAEADLHRDLGERGRRHETRAALRELALVDIRMRAVEHDRDGLTEDRVAEELEALVVADAAVLVRVRAVGQGELEQLQVDVDLELLQQIRGREGRRGL